MAKRDRLAEELQQLRSLRDGDKASEEGVALLRRVLSGRRSHTVAEAAKIVGEAEIEALIPELLDAFERFMLPDPVERDPGRCAKAEAIEALRILRA